MLSFLIPVGLASVLALLSIYAPLNFPPPFEDRIIEFKPGLGTPSPFVHPFERNEILRNGMNLFENKIHEPETLIFDKDGAMFLFANDGIYKAQPQADSFADPVLVAKIKNGRALSGAFDQNGDIIFCDTILGLGRLNVADGSYKFLISNDKLYYCDDVAISTEGDVYIADATNFRAPDRDNVLSAGLATVASGGAFGRILKYIPSTGDLTVLVDNVHFANGIELAADESYLLYSASGYFKIMKYWLKGPKKETKEEFLQQSFPGYTDGIGKGSNSTYWLAMFAPVQNLQLLLLSTRLTRWLIYRIPTALAEKIVTHYGMVAQTDENGKVLRSFHDSSGYFGRTTSVVERNGKLYVGSFTSLVKVLDLNNMPTQ